jgi:hypothetical protein
MINNLVTIEYHGKEYELVTKHGEITGKELFKVRGTDIWVPAPAENAVRYHLNILKHHGHNSEEDGSRQNSRQTSGQDGNQSRKAKPRRRESND